MNLPAAGGAPAEGPSPQNRRHFLRASALAAPATLLAAGAARAAGTNNNNGNGNGNGNGNVLDIPDLYPGWNARNFSEIRADENAHVQFLTNTLGSNALPAPAFNTQALTIPTTYPIFFAAYAQVFENTGAATYLNASPLIYDKGYLAAAGSIYAVEAYHSGYLNTLIGGTMTLNGQPFQAPFTIQQTLLNISPYFVDPTPVVQLANSISTTPSAANDLKILNFALVLERLEQTFYNINVPRFFGV